MNILKRLMDAYQLYTGLRRLLWYKILIH